MSQMELGIKSAVSTRHLSFVETGRSKPSREMILHLARLLDIPLRERNRLLSAAGFAPVYGEEKLESAELDFVRSAIAHVLKGHEPWPALVVDRHWNVLDMNSGVQLLLQGVSSELLASPNALRLSLHPEGLSSRIVNLKQWRYQILKRLDQQAERTADIALRVLYDELAEYQRDEHEPPYVNISPGADRSVDVVIPFLLRHDDVTLSFFSTTTLFGTPANVIVEELAIESFFPADAGTAAYLSKSAV